MTDDDLTMVAQGRICNWTHVLREQEEVILHSPHTYPGWAVRMFRTPSGYDVTYLHKGRAVPPGEMTGPFSSAILQHEGWRPMDAAQADALRAKMADLTPAG